MIEQKKPQAGEWWFANDGSGRVYVIGQTTADVSVYELKDGLVLRDSDWSNWHHEPRCTGWDWQPQPDPEPEWFDLTPFGEHVLRRGVDHIALNGKDFQPVAGFTGAIIAHARIAGWSKFRCLLKDAPPELVAKASKPAEDAYGYCPICGAPGVSRERRLNGNDRCSNGHEYPSKDAMPSAKPNSIVFHEFIVKHSWDNEPAAYHLEWSSDTREHANWIPTGRTETREVVQ